MQVILHNKTDLIHQRMSEVYSAFLRTCHHAGPAVITLTRKKNNRVSSTSIWEALTRLAQEQFVSYYSNIGVSVISLCRKDVKEIYQLIGDFDSLAIRYASEHPRQEDILAELRENLEQSGRRDISISDRNAYSDEFHLIFYKYCRNSRLVSSAEQLLHSLRYAEDLVSE